MVRFSMTNPRMLKKWLKSIYFINKIIINYEKYYSIIFILISQLVTETKFYNFV